MRRPLASLACTTLLALGMPSSGPAQSPIPAGVERLERPDHSAIAGRFSGDAERGFSFQATDGGRPLPIGGPARISVSGAVPEAAAGAKPFQVIIGNDSRISGRLKEITKDSVLLDDGPGGKPVVIRRDAVRGVIQRPGEAQVLSDSFDAIDSPRWTATGEPVVEEGAAGRSGKVVKLPGSGSSLTTRLAEPIASGRFEIAYYDPGGRSPGHRHYIDLSFRSPSGDLSSVRAVLGWSEDSLAVESPHGPGLAVQPLARKAGWHRLIVRFGPDRLDLQVDQDELAHGGGPPGPLAEIRLAAEIAGKMPAPIIPSALFDDLRLAKIALPVGRPELDPDQDEIRMISGDQLFGRLRRADAESIEFLLGDKAVRYPWSEVSGVHLRRLPAVGEPIDGLLARIDWRNAPSNDGRDLDFANGALVSADDREWVLATPYCGLLTIPRNRVSSLDIRGLARRVILDAYPHHLGDRVVADLDPPQAEPSPLTIPFDLGQRPEGLALLTIDVVQVIPEIGDPDFSALVKKGELRTRVLLNGQVIDDLNRHVSPRNDAPEQVRLPIPPGLLREGKNELRFEQIGTKDDPEKRDNLGILGVALESPASRLPENQRP